MIKQYYEILKLDNSATLADIKKAYRNQAKLLHPDVSKVPDAQERFILLNEAYEYLQNLKTGIINSKRSSSNQNAEYYSDDYWEQSEREKARERAQQHAQMKYEAFTKTDFYRAAVALNAFMHYLTLFVALSIFITPIYGYYQQGIKGLVGGLLIIFVTVHFWTDILIYNSWKPPHRL